MNIHIPVVGCRLAENAGRARILSLTRQAGSSAIVVETCRRPPLRCCDYVYDPMFMLPFRWRLALKNDSDFR
jgi:hypothetical protein